MYGVKYNATMEHSRLHVVFDEIINYHVVANFGIVQGSALMFRHDVAVCPIFQQEANYICISPLTSLTKKTIQYLTVTIAFSISFCS